MRILLSLIILFAPLCDLRAQMVRIPGPGGVVATATGIALVNTDSGTNQTSTKLLTISTSGASVTAGNLLTATCRGGSTSTDLPNSVTDTALNTFTLLASVTAISGNTYSFWYAKNVSGNAADVVSCVWSLGQEQAFSGIITAQYSGLNATSPSDAAITGAAGGPVSSITSASFTTTSANEVIVISATCGSASQTYAAGSIGSGTGTIRKSDAAPGSEAMTLEDLIVSTIQTGITGSVSGNSCNGWELVGGTFKP